MKNDFKNNVNYNITNWQVSLSKMCHEWPNNAVTHECESEIKNDNFTLSFLFNSIQNIFYLYNKYYN
jgi:hypothetical protein